MLETESRGLSVGLFVTLVSPAKTAEPIEMPSGLRTWSPRDHVLDGGSDPPWEGANFGGENGRPIVTFCRAVCKSVKSGQTGLVGHAWTCPTK